MELLIFLKHNWKPILVSFVILSLLIFTELYGRYKYDLGVKNATTEMQKKLDAIAIKQAKQMAGASKTYQATKADLDKKERIQYVEIEKVVEKPVYISDCIDDDGLHEINRAITKE